MIHRNPDNFTRAERTRIARQCRRISSFKGFRRVHESEVFGFVIDRIDERNVPTTEAMSDDAVIRAFTSR